LSAICSDSELKRLSDHTIHQAKLSILQEAIEARNTQSTFSQYDGGIFCRLPRNEALALYLQYPNYRTLRQEIISVLKELQVSDKITITYIKQVLWLIPFYQVDSAEIVRRTIIEIASEIDGHE